MNTAVASRIRSLIPCRRESSAVRGQRLIDAVRSRADQMASLTSSQMLRTVSDLRIRMADHADAPDDASLVESFALMTEAVRRSTGKIYYDVQLLGGFAMAGGAIAEMQTGEGKTLTTGLPAFTRALAGRGVHIATTNAYLAARDRAELQPAFELLGMSVGLLPDEHNQQQKVEAYGCDVTFGTGYEFGFDFLRDQIALRSRPELQLGTRHLLKIRRQSIDQAELLQQQHAFAIVDEADSVLIDEATMPLILSVPIADSGATKLLQLAAATAGALEQDVDFETNESAKTIHFSEPGWQRLHEPLQRNKIRGLRRPWSNYVEQALRALLFLNRDVDYVVIDGEVQIVDQQTGRIHAERSWRDGLHQAVEVKEQVEVSPEKASNGRVSRQKYFQLYNQLCGMTGTATGNEAEFHRFYDTEVIPIDTHRPCQRLSLPSRFFATNADRNTAVADAVEECHQRGQPILVGTRTIRHSLELADLLHQRQIKHQLLNGIQNEEEATIIATAGTTASVTIATNMAGRGTDIKLDSNARATGGLHVIAAEHNTSPRVDRQLAGRSARQGQPGSVQFFVSADDELFVTGDSDLPDRIRQQCESTGETRQSFESEVSQLQEQLERSFFARRQQMVQRDHWVDDVLETLARQN